MYYKNTFDFNATAAAASETFCGNIFASGDAESADKCLVAKNSLPSIPGKDTRPRMKTLHTK
jgi:hypothetical protein